MNIQLFLDLEDTVITSAGDGWHLSELILPNIERLKRYIEEVKPDSVHVFSFAIWNDEELMKFNKSIRGHLEEALGIQFAHVFTTDGEITPACAVVNRMLPSLVPHTNSAMW